jgi:methyl-accepting chemotaxis protein
MLKNLSVAAKIYLLSGVLIAVLAITIAVSYFVGTSVIKDLNSAATVGAQATQLVDTTREAQVSFQRQVQEWKNILLRGKSEDDYNRYLAQFNAQNEIVTKQLSQVTEAMRSVGQDLTLLDSIKVTHASLMPKYMAGLKLYDRANPISYQLVDTAVRGIDRDTSSNLDKLVDTIEKSEKIRVDKIKNDADSTANLAALLFVGLLALILLAAAGAFFVAKTLVGNVSTVAATIQKVAGGDYGARVKLNTTDEIGTLGKAFNALLDDRLAALAKAEKENDTLNNSVIGLLGTVADLSQKDLTVRAPVTEDIIGTLGDSVNQLTDATTSVLRDVSKIAGVVEHASKRVKAQSDAVSEQATLDRATVEKLVANLALATEGMGRVAELAQSSNRAASEASTSTENAMNTVQSTVRGMDAIRETISEMEKRIKRLGERSQEISQIVGLINTISERTHVLSLNASMQAAMAGDAGRGFAVVAEEVQRLAENSRQATAQIASLVQNIQIETNDTIATVNKTIDQVVQGSDMARVSGDKMRETRDTTERLVQLVQNIAESSLGQMKLVESLRLGAGEITESTEKTAEQLNAQNQVTSSLVTASQKLVESVSVFKLPAVTQS